MLDNESLTRVTDDPEGFCVVEINEDLYPSQKNLHYFEKGLQ